MNLMIYNNVSERTAPISLRSPFASGYQKPELVPSRAQSAGKHAAAGLITASQTPIRTLIPCTRACYTRTLAGCP